MTPTVSVIVPCYNEQATIRHLLDAILAQTYPLGQLEVIIADGHSTDGTRDAINGFQKEHLRLAVRVVDNDKGTIPAGLNTAINASSGQFIVRLDAHSMPDPEYVANCVRALEEGRGANVGGVWQIRPGAQTWIASAIAAAAAHPLGAGDALYRLSPQAGAVDTVPFGAFRRELIQSIGKFDETLLSNEDYEFNARIRRAGGTVWLDPMIRSVYFARGTLSELARQYWRYGYWKRRMLRKYPATLRWRQGLPPAFILILIVLAVLSLWLDMARLGLILILTVYVLVLLLAGIVAAIKTKKSFLILGLPLAVATMHFSWGSGFLWSLASVRTTK